jgi:hypothetical protein
MRLVPVLFVATIPISGFVGVAVARLYSEPMNQLLRSKPGSTGRNLSSIQIAYEQTDFRMAP